MLLSNLHVGLQVRVDKPVHEKDTQLGTIKKIHGPGKSNFPYMGDVDIFFESDNSTVRFNSNYLVRDFPEYND